MEICQIISEIGPHNFMIIKNNPQLIECVAIYMNGRWIGQIRQKQQTGGTLTVLFETKAIYENEVDALFDIQSAIKKIQSGN